MATSARLEFVLPDALHAAAPPERRGIRRDHVKMLVLHRQTGDVQHDRFYNLEQYVSSGDIIVLNNSRTLPAALTASLWRQGCLLAEYVEIRLARRIQENMWDVLVMHPVQAGDTLLLSSTLSASVTEASKENAFVRVVFSLEGAALLGEVYSLGEPIRYEYIQEPWGLEYYQTVFASKPGSLEMPSAGRAFSWQMLNRLQKQGIRIAYLQLHTGLSDVLDDTKVYSPAENLEEYEIPQETMERIRQAKQEGGRVIAVGTTVVRALETAAKTGRLSGWTNLYITKEYRLQLVDAIITGMHEPKASHLDLLCAFVSPVHLLQAYSLAIDEQYLWHEFGDMNLIM